LVIVLCFGLTLAACGKQQVSYPIDSNVSTTLQKTIALGITASGSPIELSSISQYSKYGYGAWTYGAGLPAWKHSELVFEKKQLIPGLQELLISYSKL